MLQMSNKLLDRLLFVVGLWVRRYAKPFTSIIFLIFKGKIKKLNYGTEE